MTQEIPFYSKNVYGEWKMYVADASTAAKLSALTGTKTLTDGDKRKWEALGFSFVEVIAPRS